MLFSIETPPRVTEVWRPLPAREDEAGLQLRQSDSQYFGGIRSTLGAIGDGETMADRTRVKVRLRNTR